jgi:hypothetical protein
LEVAQGYLTGIIPIAQLIFYPDIPVVPNWRLMNKEALRNLSIDFSLDGWRANFAENLRNFSFNKDLKNETTFSLFSLDGHYL